MDIEERAEKWAKIYLTEDHDDKTHEEDLVAAYLAGSQQTQKDYLAHFMGKGDKRWS